MAGYADMFLKKGLKSMSQLENFTEEDLTSLRIGEAHQEAIWKALQERFGLGNALLSSQVSEWILHMHNTLDITYAISIYIYLAINLF